MLSTKNIIFDLQQVPKVWIFEYYLNLKEKLVGQDIKILSVFNAKDKIPSMCIYMDPVSNNYKFKDFSSGNSGDGIELVKCLFNLPGRGPATGKIINDYQEYLKYNNVANVPEITFHDKFKVTDFQIRHWNNFDQNYWSAFKISSARLSKFRVRALEHFTMEKTELDGSVTSFTFNKPFLYGYFRADGSLYKIYMPKNQEKKFIKVSNYIQGSEQLEYNQKYLIVTSSLKDLMCFDALQIGNTEAIAPDSENTMIGESSMEKLMKAYSKVIILFDNDDPGIKAAKRYQEKYGLNYIVLPLEKDLSDSVKKYGLDKVKEILFPLLKESLK